MGAVLQTAGAAELVAELTCCACSSVCGLVTRDSATRAKFRYCSFLFMATVTCIILLIPGLRYKLDKIPNFCGSKLISNNTCDKFVGFSAVYRILFSISLFHFILSILTIRVTRVKSFRAKFNNGLWLFKMGLLFMLTIAAFYIPKKSGFFRIWMYISLTGGFMFVMFQIILIIDFGHSWSLSWAEKLETGYTKLWYVAMAFVTLLMFSLSLGAVISFFTFFTHPQNILKCHANVFYITFITIQCFVATIISVTPSVQQELVGAGLLQSSVVILYTMYLTWNTLSTEPDSMCNPLGNIILEYDSLTGVSGEAIFGCMLTLILLVFACVVRASTSHLGKYGLALAESEEFAMATYYEDKSRENVETKLESGEKEVSLDEYVGYNYSFFHIIMALASLHVLMVLTNWHSPEENSNMRKLVKNWASVWVQMASSFVCILVYVWFLVTPLIKKVWGPLFGLTIDDDFNKSPSRKPLLSKQKKQKNTALKNESDIQNTAPNIQRPKSRTTNQRDDNESVKPASSKNTYNPNATAISISENMKRKNFNDTLATLATGLTGTTSRREKKIRKRLLTVDNTDNESNFSIPHKIIIPSKSHKAESSIASLAPSKIKQNKKLNVDTQSLLNTSIRTPKKKKSSLNEPLQIHKSSHRSKLLQHEQNQNNIEDNSKQTETIKHINKKSNTNNNLTTNKENNCLKDKSKTRDEILQDFSIDGGEPSVCPSVFKKEVQRPEVAKELLKLQWKILRTQAKVVKIQERIIRLQTDAETPIEPSTPPPMLDGSFVPPPLLESSTYTEGRRSRNNKRPNSKEHG